MSDPAERETIVVIDDDHAMRLSCLKILAKAGFRVEVFEDGTRGLEGIARLRPSLVIVDLKMPGISGMEVIQRIPAMDPDIVTVVITGYATIDTAVEAMKAGAYDFLPKPFSPDALRFIVGRALERRRLTLEAKHCELERERMKRRFVTFVSHQLQTPLVAIHQYLDVLKHLESSGGSVAARMEWYERCLRRTGELQALIRDWLTLAKLECGQMRGQIARVDLKPVLLDLAKTYEPMAGAEGVSLETRLAADEYPVRGDLHCLSVLFDNLIANAIKYNRPGGEVTVSGRAAEDEIEIAVADTGIGIPEKYLPLVFEEFFRVEGETGKKTAGTGLGLPISKRIVAELGGAIEVESQTGAGSTFRVKLPAWHEEQAPAETVGVTNDGTDQNHSDRG